MKILIFILIWLILKFFENFEIFGILKFLENFEL
jgi:hypothetical protein